MQFIVDKLYGLLTPSGYVSRNLVDHLLTTPTECPCEFSEINEIEMNGSDPDGYNFFPSKSLTANALEYVLLTSGSGMPKMSLFALFFVDPVRFNKTCHR